MDLTKSSETKHLYLGDSNGSLLPTWDRSPNVTSDVNCKTVSVWHVHCITITNQHYCKWKYLLIAVNNIQSIWLVVKLWYSREKNRKSKQWKLARKNLHQLPMYEWYILCQSEGQETSLFITAYFSITQKSNLWENIHRWLSRNISNGTEDCHKSIQRKLLGSQHMLTSLCQAEINHTRSLTLQQKFTLHFFKLRNFLSAPLCDCDFSLQFVVR